MNIETDNGDRYESTTSRNWMALLCLVVLVIGICLLWIGVNAYLGAKGEPKLTVAILDVGQGDAIYIKTPSGNDILIDGGPDEAVLSSLAEAMPLFDREIDVVIASHSDSDHIGGLIPVFDRYEVKQFMYSGAEKDSGMRRELDLRIEQEKISDETMVQIVDTGDSVVLDGTYGVYAEVLSPQAVSSSTEDSNNMSVVLLLHYNQTDFLFTGDISDVVEKDLVATYGDKLQAEVLKVGHHGSKSSSDTEFLKIVAPHFALISVGEVNSYGHPSKEAIERLEALGTSTQIHITKDEGTITLVSDGHSVELVR